MSLIIVCLPGCGEHTHPVLGGARGSTLAEPRLATEEAPLYPPRTLLRERCTPPTVGEPSVRTKHQREGSFDFEEETLRPLPFGPRVNDQPMIPVAWGELDLASALEEHRGELSGCYRWARFRKPGLGGRLVLDIRCDELGRCAELHVTPQMKGGEELAACTRGDPALSLAQAHHYHHLPSAPRA